MRSCLLSALIAFVATVVLPASPASAQTVRDSVRMTLSIYTFYNSYVIGDTPRAACGAGVVATWPNVLQAVLGSETRTYGYHDYGRVATEGMYIPTGYGEEEAPEGFLAHNPQLGGASDGPGSCDLGAHIASASYRMNGGTGPLNGSPFQVTDWYATFTIPDGVPIALFEWERAPEAAIAFDASFESGLSREIDASAPGGNRPVARYVWDFGDGTAGSGAKPMHFYDEPGDYLVRLTVTDDDGEEESWEETVSVYGAQLTVDILSATEEATQGDTVMVVGRVTNSGAEAVTAFSAQRAFSYVTRIPDEIAHPAGQVRNLDVDLVDLAPDEDEAVTRSRLEPGESVEVTRSYVVTRSADFRIFNETDFAPADVFRDWTGIPRVEAQPTESDSVLVGQLCQTPDARCATTKIIRYDPNLAYTVDLGGQVVVAVGDSLAVRITVTNTGSLPLETIQLGDDIEAVDGGTSVLADLGAETAVIDRLEPGQSGTLVHLFEAVEAVDDAQLYVPSVAAEAVNPINDQRSDHVEEAPVCEANTTSLSVAAFGFQAADDPENAGCATFSIMSEALVVNVTGDEENDPQSQTDNVCDVDRTEPGPQCTLRAAIQVANERSASEDVAIAFDLPGTAPHTIAVASSLVVAYNGDDAGHVMIDGYRPTMEVYVRGGGSGIGFDVLGEATLRGISISGFTTGVRLQRGSTVRQSYIEENINGIAIELDNNVVEFNLISRNSGTGVVVFGAAAYQNTIAQNYIGTTDDGSAANGNTNGIYLNGAISNLVEGNLISGNSESGLYLGGGASTNTVATNYIGTAISTEVEVPNRDGIVLAGASSNLITNNLVAGNTFAELYVGAEAGVRASGNLIESNAFGVNGGRTNPLGSGFVHFQNADRNTFGGNTSGLGNLVQVLYVEDGHENLIASNAIGTQRDYVQALSAPQIYGNNGLVLGGGATDNIVQSNAVGYRNGAGIFVEPGARGNRIEYNASFFNAGSGVTVEETVAHTNSIRVNSIYDNAFLGIDLGYDGSPTPGGGSVPPQPSVNAYALASDRSRIFVYGNLPGGRADQSYTIDVYAIRESGCDPSGYGEGDYWIGALQTRGSGPFAVSMLFPSRQSEVPYSAVSATATFPSGTSEFGLCSAVADDPPPSALVDVWPGDTDNDGSVGEADRTPIQEHLMAGGPARREASDLWQAQPAFPWAPEATTYADANGDGRVDQTDLLIVALNFGQTHATQQAREIAARVEAGDTGDAVPTALERSDSVATATTFTEPPEPPTLVRSERPSLPTPTPRTLDGDSHPRSFATEPPHGAPEGAFPGAAEPPTRATSERPGLSAAADAPPTVSAPAAHNASPSPELRVVLDTHDNRVPVLLKLDADEPRLTGVAFAMRMSPGVSLVETRVGAFDDNNLLVFEHIDEATGTLRAAYARKGGDGTMQAAGETVIELILDTSAAADSAEITLTEMSLATEWGVSGQATFRVDTELSTSTEELEMLDYVLEANWPNPFSERTTLRFSLPQPANVRLTVYDLLGREVERLAEDSLPAGTHDWVFDGAGLPAGMYVYRLQAGAREFTRRMLLVR